jgi:protein TonB
MAFVRSTRLERGRGALVAAALTGVLGYALVAGLAARRSAGGDEALRLFEITPPPAPPERKVVPEPRRNTRPEGEASPPNLRAEPTEIVAPEPIVPVVVPPPVASAPVAGTGAAPSAGSADVPGPGTGSGGFGDGRGSGGDGDGDGGGAGDETPPRWLRGDFRGVDYPEALAEAGIEGTVGVRYVVWTNGRVTDCEVSRSSGSADLDALTCRVIRERFRYRPSLDRRGRPVPSVIVENHSWSIRREPAQEQPTQVRRRSWF